MKTHRFLSLVIAGSGLVASWASAEEWPQFRGPDGQGHAAATRLATAWSETENIRWKVEVPGLGWSSPVVYGKQIWLTTAVDAEGSLRGMPGSRQRSHAAQRGSISRAGPGPDRVEEQPCLADAGR